MPVRWRLPGHPRLCARTVGLSTNHGGVAVVAAAGIWLTMLDLGLTPYSFELLCIRVASSLSSCVIVLIYRTGPVTPAFFTELSDILDRVVMYIDPVFLIGDFNICLNHVDDLVSRQSTDVLTAHGLLCHVITRRTIAVACSMSLPVAPTCSRHPSTCWIAVYQIRLLQSSSALVRPRPVYSSMTRRSWQRLDKAAFCEWLLSSPLSQPDTWSEHDVDGITIMYDEKIIMALNQLIPTQTVKCHCRPSDPRFDQDCQATKHQTWRLERAARWANPNDAAAIAAATAMWTAQWRAYCDLLHTKRGEFWQDKANYKW